MNNTEKRTFLQQDTFVFKWRIERFFADCKTIGDHYKSPTFSIKYDNKITKWHLTVYPKGDCVQSINHLSLYLHSSSEKNIKITGKCGLSILDEQQNIPAGLCKAMLTFYKDLPINLGWSHFLRHSCVRDPLLGMLTNDSLTILCKITITACSPVDDLYNCNEDLDMTENGLDDYEKLLDSDNFSDVNFNVKGKYIKAHKAILSCRSPIFKAMFEHDMKENKENVVDIIDIDYDVMLELFRFIYSGKVHNIEQLADDLLLAADKYDMMQLKAMCEKILCESISIENAVELKLTNMCDTVQLKKIVIKFIAAHHKDVVKKPGFADLDKDTMYQLMLALSEN